MTGEGGEINLDASATVANTLTVKPRREPGMVLSEAHYKRIQKRIRSGVGDHAASIWLALALFFLGVGITVVVTVISTELGGETTGKLEMAGWACLVLTVVCVGAHFNRAADRRKLAEDICEDMDTHCVRSGGEDA
jgi:hypothetical protein